jgi:ribosome-binding factor A
MTTDGRRVRRVADLLRAELTEALLRDLGDPELAEVVITEVSVTADLGVARIGVRRLSDAADETRRRSLVRALGKASGRLRHLVGPKLGLRRTPELRFSYDEGPDAQRRVEELLGVIAKEPHSGSEEQK